MTTNKILIVDDDARNIFALSAVLRSKGYTCLVANSGEEALKVLKNEQHIGIVLLDMMMPEMDGYETISIIRKGEHKHLPVISTTAQAMVGDREKCLDAGADGYLPKPIDVDKLFDLLKQYLT
jgi:two-component system, cell cycle response regulator DivK